MSNLTDLRDQVYTRLLLKKTLAEFSFNDFGAEKCWLPKKSFDSFGIDFPNGVVWVIAGVAGDRISGSRDNMVKAEYSVKVGYAKLLSDPTNVAAIDALTDFIEELDAMCRKEIEPNTDFAYNRTEFEKDENGIPFSFVHLDQLATFEAYFNVYYHIVLP